MSGAAGSVRLGKHTVCGPLGKPGAHARTVSPGDRGSPRHWHHDLDNERDTSDLYEALTSNPWPLSVLGGYGP